MALFKKVSAATLALLIGASTVTASAASEKILLSSRYGDADNNSVINTRDFVAMADAILNPEKKGNVSKDGKIYNADFNFDKKYTVEDMAVLKKMLITGKLVNAFDAYSAQKSMISAYLKAEKSKIESVIDSEVDDNGTEYTSKTTSYITRTGSVAYITSNAVQNSGSVSQEVYMETTDDNMLGIYKKVNNSNWNRDKKAQSSSALQETVVDVIKTAQIPASADVPSLNILEKLLLNPNVISEANFANAYTYEDANFKYIAVPVEDVVDHSDAKVTDTAGTYIITIDAKTGLPELIEVVIGTSTYDSTSLVENGYAKFTYDGIDNIVIPDGVRSDSEIDNPVTTSVTTGDEPIVTSVTTGDEPIVTSVTTGDEPIVTSVTTGDEPVVTTTTSSDEPEFPEETESAYDILVKSAKALKDTDNIIIDADTVEKGTNEGKDYTNKTSAKAVRCGNIIKSEASGSSTANGETYEYSQQSILVNHKNGTVDAYVNGTIGEDDTTGWIYRKNSKNIKTLKADAIDAAQTAFVNVIDQLMSDPANEEHKDEYSDIKKNPVDQLEKLFGVNIPSKDSFMDIIKGDATKQERINRNSTVVFDKENNVYVISFDAAAITSETNNYIAGSEGIYEYTVKADDYKPVRIEIKGAQIAANENNAKATGTSDTLVVFEYPSTTSVDISEVTNAKEFNEYINSEEFAKLAAKYVKTQVEAEF